ncbi:MAG: tRNA (guanosine(37)-N1)-methyltransferase TrmD [Candidatus Omnitrophica bacterium]|nr:tRNA (guanosine(37)-N1)-methyltransferase TrmD [Candidatus Omnitrophota bacterium]
MLRFDIITLFPKVFNGIFNESMIKRAKEKKKVLIKIHDLRDYSSDKKRHSVDDRPFGGGPGMVLSPQPLFDAVKKIKGRKKAKVIYVTPSGVPFSQSHAKRLTKHKNLIIICGHYEGIDERVREHIVDEEFSIGDYVLTGGEIPAMVMVDAITRLIPGVLGKDESLVNESFEADLLEGPQYTRPADFHGLKVPPVLLSGHHQQIAQWRRAQAVQHTQKIRPDLAGKWRQHRGQ